MPPTGIEMNEIREIGNVFSTPPGIEFTIHPGNEIFGWQGGRIFDVTVVIVHESGLHCLIVTSDASETNASSLTRPECCSFSPGTLVGTLGE